MNKKSINPNEKVPKTDHRGSACSTTLNIQSYIYNITYQNKENNINNDISHYFIPSNNINLHINYTHLYYRYTKPNKIYLISMKTTKNKAKKPLHKFIIFSNKRNAIEVVETNSTYGRTLLKCPIRTQTAAASRTKAQFT